MITAFAFVVAASAGTLIRHRARTLLDSSPFPFGTLAVNLVGCLVLGLVSSWQGPVSTVVGVAGLGALTTFSTFAEEVVDLRAGGAGPVLAYVTASVVGGIVLAWIGLSIGR